MPYNGENTNRLENGILLRADIHTLFDLNLLQIDTNSMTVIVAPELENSVYAELSGSKLMAKPAILKRIKSALDSKWNT